MTPNLSQDYVRELERLNGRGKSVYEHLVRDAKTLAEDFSRLASHNDWEGAAQDPPSYELMFRVVRWQARLDEIVKSYTQLLAIRSEHREEFNRESNVIYRGHSDA